MLFIAHLCNHILLQSGGGTWDTALHTVRGVGSGSRDVDAGRKRSLYAEDRGPPSTDDPAASPSGLIPSQRPLDRCVPAYPSGPH
jgi:hypothetical protein